VIASGADISLICVNALSGTRLLIAELVPEVEAVVLLELPLPGCVVDSAVDDGVSAPDDGVYLAACVVAFEPAEDDPDAANDVDAPAPVAPDEPFAWM
jgi:hypothetical protein